MVWGLCNNVGVDMVGMLWCGAYVIMWVWIWWVCYGMGVLVMGNSIPRLP